MAGMVGSETAFGVCCHQALQEEGLPLELLVPGEHHLAEIIGWWAAKDQPGARLRCGLGAAVDLDSLWTKKSCTPRAITAPDGAQLYGRGLCHHQGQADLSG